MSAAHPSSPGLRDSVETRILDAALLRFGEFGVKKTTIEDIARQAGVDRVTVYRRIGSRDDVVQAVASREVATVLTELDALPTNHTDLGEMMADVFIMVMTRWRNHTLVNRMLALEPERILPKLTIDGSPVFAMSVAATHTALCRAADAGLMDDPPDLLNRAEVMCRIVHSFILGPQGVISIETDQELADFARTYLVPIVSG